MEELKEGRNSGRTYRLLGRWSGRVAAARVVWAVVAPFVLSVAFLGSREPGTGPPRRAVTTVEASCRGAEGGRNF